MDLKGRARNEQRIFEGLQGKFSDRPNADLEADNRFLFPRIKEIFAGNTGLSFYANPIVSAARSRPVRVLSLGSGDGEVEFGLTRIFRDAHVDNVRLDAVELSENLVDRCNFVAQQNNLAPDLNFYQQDINT